MSLSREERSTLVRRFHLAWLQVSDEAQAQDVELLPTTLAVAAAETVKADGAGLSVLNEQHRVPIGASGHAATAAERLQYTVGDGPCLDALAAGRAVRVDEDQIRTDWPTFHAELIRETPYRSVIAVPFHLADDVAGALDLYFHTSDMPAHATVVDATEIAHHIAALLRHANAMATDPPADLPSLPIWMNAGVARERLRVWVAVGVLMYSSNVTAPDALTMIRARAYSHEVSIDELVGDILSGGIDPAEFGRSDAG